MKKLTPVESDIKQALDVNPRDLTSNQEAVPVPWFAGQRAIPLSWIMEPVGQFTAPTPGQNLKK